MITITETLYKKMPDDIKACFNQLPNPSSEEVRECFPETKGDKKVGKNTVGQKGVFSGRLYGKEKGLVNETDRNVVDGGGNASRYFKSIIYQAKASKSERNKGCEGLEVKQTQGGGGGIGDYENDVNSMSGKYGSEKAPANNNHPTVKPIALMEYLVKLVTPSKGTVLDPFMGSGTTCLACQQLGKKYVGIELEEEYVKIAKARLRQEALL